MQKHQNGLADTGLYDTGLQYVVMDVVFSDCNLVCSVRA